MYGDRAAAIQVDVIPMLVGVGEFLQEQKPVMSIARLQLLDEYDVFDRESFEVALNARPEVIWALTDRKLRAAFRRSRRRMSLPHCIGCGNQLIEHRSQFSRYSPQLQGLCT